MTGNDPSGSPDTAPVDTLLAANRAFYGAFEALDLGAMASVWEESERIFCVHPGWQALRGHEAVMESWAVILSNTSRIQFTLTGVEARTSGEVGIVTLHENILSQVGSQRHTASAVSTNLFLLDRELGQWKLFHHHASLTVLPEESEGPVN